MLTDEQIEAISHCVYGGCPDRNPEVDCRLLLNEVKRLRDELASIDQGVQRQECEECNADTYSLTKMGERWRCGRCCYCYGRDSLT